MDYVFMQEQATNLLDHFGRNWVVRRINKGEYDPSTNTRTIDETSDFTGKAVRLEYDQKQVDGEVIRSDDFQLIIEAKNLGVVPTVHDKVIDDACVYEIISIKKIQPKDTIIYFEMQLR